MHDLCNALAEVGVRSLVAVHDVGDSEVTVPSDARYELRILPALPTRSAHEQTRLDPAEAVPGFAALLDDFAPELVNFHAFTAGAGPAQASALRARGIPYVITYHTATMSCPSGRLIERGTPCDGRIEARRCAACVMGEKGVAPALAAVLARSPLRSSPAALPQKLRTALTLSTAIHDRAQHWQTFFANAAHIIACAAWVEPLLRRNGLDAAAITVLRQGLRGATRRRALSSPVSGKRRLTLGFFGRLEADKGLGLAHDAVEILRERGHDAHLALVGPTTAIWRDDDVASYHGVKRGAELSRWLASVDLLLVPSLVPETGPLTLLEAWDLGVPVVGVDRGGIAEFLRHEGLDSGLASPDDPEALADAVERVLGGAMRGREVMIPGMQEVAADVCAIYKSAMARTPVSPPRGASV